jgi:serine/threonine protein kinase
MAGELRPNDPVQMGPYRLVGVLGGGGMGRVYLGQSAGGRRVAVKVIRPDLADDSQFRKRFGREVSAARRVSGLYTALVVDAEVDGPVPWLATAYIDGPALSAEVEDSGPFGLARLLDLAAGLAEGLAAVHKAEIVHRDLKPSNVLLGPDGPVIVDFGISRAVEATTLTSAGVLIGSPGFMAPEQVLDSSSVSSASDVFSLGALLCYAATGRGPFGEGMLESIVYRTVHGQPDLGGVPDELRPLVARCLDRDPARRPATADVLARVAAQRSPTWRADGSTLPAPEARTADAWAAAVPPTNLLTAPFSPAPAYREAVPPQEEAGVPVPPVRAPRGSAQPKSDPPDRPRRPPGHRRLRRRRRRASWLIAGAVIAAAAAVTIPLLASAQANKTPASASLKPPLTQGQARQVLADATRVNNQANGAQSATQLATVEGGSSLAIDSADYRQQQAGNSRAYPSFAPLQASYYIPLESPDVYPHWFAVYETNPVDRSTGGGYLIFTQSGPGASWLDVLEPFVNAAEVPTVAVNSSGYATAVPVNAAGLAMSPAAASRTTAGSLDSGTGQPADPGDLTDSGESEALQQSLPAKSKVTVTRSGAASPLFGLRTTNGGALLFYDVTADLTVDAPAGKTVSLKVPGFFSTADPVSSAVIDYDEEFATEDPLRGTGTVSVIADYSGITGRE